MSYRKILKAYAYSRILRINPIGRLQSLLESNVDFRSMSPLDFPPVKSRDRWIQWIPISHGYTFGEAPGLFSSLLLMYA